MIDIILLAAGNSVRYGGNKLLVEINGKPMFQYAIDMAVYCHIALDCIGKIIVVSQYDEIKKYVESQGIDIRYVENRESYKGISTSIKLGINEADLENDMMFLVCDQPYLKEKTIKGLVLGYLETEKPLACVISDGQSGNPCIFSKRYRNELLQLEADKGGKGILNRDKNLVYPFYVEENTELQDIDRPS